LPGKTRLQSELLCVEWDIKLYSFIRFAALELRRMPTGNCFCVYRWADSELNMMRHFFNDLAHYCMSKHAVRLPNFL